MQKLKTIFIATCTVLLFASCESTNLYVKESIQFYENDTLQEETESLTQDEKLKQKTEIVYGTTTLDDMHVCARTETVNDSSGKMHVQLFTGDNLYAENDFTVHGETVSSATMPGEKAKQLTRAANKVLAEKAQKSSDDAAGTQTRLLMLSEQVQVDSTINKPFVIYTIFGKPLVIAGATSLNLLKCAGYAFINFLGGYNTVVNGNFFWKMPDVKKARQKAAQARAANEITVYPEYHKAFTNNKITVTATTSESINAIAAASGDVKVLSKETMIYSNKLSVERSAAADANATAAVIGFVGTVITVPVSIVTWIGGAAVGIYSEMQN